MFGSFKIKRYIVATLAATTLTASLAACGSDNDDAANTVGSGAWQLSMIGNDPNTSPLIRDVINSGQDACKYYVTVHAEPTYTEFITEEDVEKAQSLQEACGGGKVGSSMYRADLLQGCAYGVDSDKSYLMGSATRWGYPSASHIKCASGRIW